ncbi:hypothetical protein GCM10011608_39810 [Micromonospora sonchi]|uniref:Uncharacterized protein n=1 Tax=Micromonospora sonchi TaxID=1763543 RepID=A0A917U1J4_9ACTN|nr:hypothetical protein [Micromonospora sonchi]GGM50964.1 hypothetical protein GCM10011608_39810 [Micromonospora sonchi]
MTTDNAEPLPAQGRTPRHRLTPSDQLAAAYLRRYKDPAVAEYALAVRDLVERHIGPVDTWSRLAERLCQGGKREKRIWRKKLSRHFTAECKGPPWQTVDRIVKCIVPSPGRPALLAEFGRLHNAARGEPPPHEHASAQAREVGESSAHTQPDQRRDPTDLERENADLRRRLATSKAEIHRLQGQLRGTGTTMPTGEPESTSPPHNELATILPRGASRNQGPFSTEHGDVGGNDPEHRQRLRVDMTMFRSQHAPAIELAGTREHTWGREARLPR